MASDFTRIELHTLAATFEDGVCDVGDLSDASFVAVGLVR
jgi:hypothetical protein